MCCRPCSGVVQWCTLQLPMCGPIFSVWFHLQLALLYLNLCITSIQLLRQVVCGMVLAAGQPAAELPAAMLCELLAVLPAVAVRLCVVPHAMSAFEMLDMGKLHGSPVWSVWCLSWQGSPVYTCTLVASQRLSLQPGFLQGAYLHWQ